MPRAGPPDNRSRRPKGGVTRHRRVSGSPVCARHDVGRVVMTTPRAGLRRDRLRRRGSSGRPRAPRARRTRSRALQNGGESAGTWKATRSTERWPASSRPRPRYRWPPSGGPGGPPPATARFFPAAGRGEALNPGQRPVRGRARRQGVLARLRPILPVRHPDHPGHRPRSPLHPRRAPDERDRAARPRTGTPTRAASPTTSSPRARSSATRSSRASATCPRSASTCSNARASRSACARWSAAR